MMSLNDALQAAQEQVPDCVAAGLVDVNTGWLLGVKTTATHPQEVLDLVAGATRDLLQSKNVVMIENIFKQRRGKKLDDKHYFQDICVWSDQLLHIFLRCPSNASHVIVFCCKNSTNMGLALAKARPTIASIEEAAA